MSCYAKLNTFTFVIFAAIQSNALAQFYVGANVGLSQSSSTQTLNNYFDRKSSSATDGMFGLNLGYELGLPILTLGVEAFGNMLSGSEQKVVLYSALNTNYKNSSMYGVKARVALNTILNPYITAGFAQIKGKYSIYRSDDHGENFNNVGSEKLTFSSGLVGVGISQNIGKFGIYGEINYLFPGTQKFEITNLQNLSGNSVKIKNMFLLQVGARFYF